MKKITQPRPTSSKLLSRAPAMAALVAIAAVAGCQHRVAIEGGEKPIKIDMTITHKVDRELDEFFAFEKKYDQPGVQPAGVDDPAVNEPTVPAK